MKTGKSGFTLIELSIVIVIIALLAAGVMLGRNLVQQATLRAVLAEVDEYSTGVHLFSEKFHALPGDFDRAEEFWGADANCPNTAYNEVVKVPTCDGNGDGLIHGDVGGQEGERFRAWQQLANAGIVSGKFSGVADNVASHLLLRAAIPASKYTGGGYTLFFETGHDADALRWAGPGRHVLDFGSVDAACPGGDEPDECSSHSPLTFPWEAEQLDAKIDDGRPGTGKVFGRPMTSTISPNCTTSDVQLNAKYDVDREEKVCSLVFDTEI